MRLMSAWTHLPTFDERTRDFEPIVRANEPPLRSDASLHSSFGVISMLRIYRRMFEPLELVGLPRLQRRFVYRHCVHTLLARWPVALSKSALWALMLVIGWYLGAFDSDVGFVVFFLCATIADECYRLSLLRWYRGRVADYLREHRAEIEGHAEPDARSNPDQP